MPRRRPRSRDGSPFKSHQQSGFNSMSPLNNGNSGEKPEQRNAANARERARMRVLSRAFCRLKTTLPWVPADTKLSKLDTLRLATSYIAHLRALLGQEDNSRVQPLSLSWPFTFHGGLGRPGDWNVSTGEGGNSAGGSSCSGSGRDEEDDDEDEEVANVTSGFNSSPSVYYHQQSLHYHHHHHHQQEQPHQHDSLLHLG